MTIYLVQLSHTDIGYTDSPSLIRVAHAEFIDMAIDMALATRDWPEQCRFRWTIETGWALRQFVEQRPHRVEALVAAIRTGQIELAAGYLHFTDAITPELLLLSTQWQQQFCEKYGLLLRDAVHNDVNGYSWSLPDAFNSIGVRRLAMGLNETTSISPMPRHSVFRWQSPAGSELLVYFGSHYNQGNYLSLASNVQLPLGPTWPDPPDHVTAEELFETSVPRVRDWVASLQNDQHPYGVVMLQSGGFQADNAAPSLRSAQIARLWAERNPVESISVRTSTLGEFFDALELEIANSPTQLPTYRACWPEYWAMGLGSCPSEVAMLRESQATLAALTLTLANHSLYPPAVEAALLAAEHTFDSWNSVFEPNSPEARGHWASKQVHFTDALSQSRRLARVQIDKLIAASTSTGDVALFDPAASPGRQSVATVELPSDVTIRELALQFADGTTTPLQEIESSGFARQFEAILPSLPTDGELASLIDNEGHHLKTTPGNSLANDFFQAVVDPENGTLVSLVDARDGRQIAGKSDEHSFGQWLHEDRPKLNRSTFGPMDKLRDAILRSPGTDNEQRLVKENMPLRSTARAAKDALIQQGPVFSELIQQLAAPGYATLQLSARLYHAHPVAMLTFTGERLALHHANADYVAFPFNTGRSARLTIEHSGGAFEPGVGQIPGTCLDFYTVHRWARLDDGERSLILAPLDAPLLSVGGIGLLGFRRAAPISQSILVSNVYNNYWYTNFPNTAIGPLRSRYLIAAFPSSTSNDALSAFVDCFRIKAIGRAVNFKAIPEPTFARQ